MRFFFCRATGTRTGIEAPEGLIHLPVALLHLLEGIQVQWSEVSKRFCTGYSQRRKCTRRIGYDSSHTITMATNNSNGDSAATVFGYQYQDGLVPTQVHAYDFKYEHEAQKKIRLEMKKRGYRRACCGG